VKEKGILGRGFPFLCRKVNASVVPAKCSQHLAQLKKNLDKKITNVYNEPTLPEKEPKSQIK
jgi:hypothetical protein